MQKVDRKKWWLVKFFFVISLTPLWAQSPWLGQLQTADSLFEMKRYTQSLDIYQEILDQDNFSPNMLLKMAFTSEALDKPAETLYYLNLYYLATGSEETLEKMQEYADEHNLKGYLSGDEDLFISLYYRNYESVIYSLTALALLILLIMLYQKVKLSMKPYGLAAVFVLLIVSLAFLANFSKNYNKAIIINQQIAAWSQPSAGSDRVSIIPKGNRVNILERADVWTKVRWNEREVYVRSFHLWSVE